MPHLMETVTGDAMKKKATNKPPFGPGFAEGDLKDIEALEVWGSLANDPGSDYCEFRLMKAGKTVKSKRIAGY